MKLGFPPVAVWILTQITSIGLASGQVLTHGPVLGGVTASSANVFVRTDQAARVALRYGTDPTLTLYQVSNTFQTNASSDFTIIIPLADLTAETPYYLDVIVNDVSQQVAPYPTFVSFPLSGSSRTFKFVVLTDFTTVTNLVNTVQTFASALAEQPAFTFIGGDFDHRNPQSITDKRQMFKDLYNPNTPYMSGFVPLILWKTPIIHQWDDHDSGTNNVDRTNHYWSENQQVFQEYVPSYPLPAVNPGIWQRFSYAQADCFVLDCRSQRDPELDPDDANKSMLDGNNLGALGELQWLKDGLLTSTARWKIIFTSVITNPTTKFPDGWAGYQTEWNALKDFINTNSIKGVVFISGDLHLGAIDNGLHAGFPEMCVSQPNGNGGCPTDSYGIWTEGYYNDRTCSGYGLVTISENPDALTLQAVDQFGTVRISYTVASPSITAQPRDETVSVGQKARFSVKATATAPISFQWRRNGTNIEGATKSSYVAPPARPTDNGALFSVVVSDTAGSVTSKTAKLTVRTPTLKHDSASRRNARHWANG